MQIKIENAEIGFIKYFSHPEQVLRWIDAEREFYDEIVLDDLLPFDTLANIKKTLSFMNALGENYVDGNVAQDDFMKKFSDYLNKQISATSYIPTKSPLLADLIATGDADDAKPLSFEQSGRARPDVLELDALTKKLDALDSKITENHLIKLIPGTLDAIAAKIQALQTTLDQQYTEHANLKTKLVDDIDSAKQAAYDAVILKLPENHWQERLIDAKRSVTVSMALFCVFAAVMIVYVALFVGLVYFEKLASKTSFVHSVLLIGSFLLTGIIFWFMKIFARQYLSAKHDIVVYSDRISMIKTFLSMSHDSDGDDGIRAYFYKYFFKTYYKDFTKDDGAPPMPQEILHKISGH